jgi:D-alanine-D-alanine ligase
VEDFQKGEELVLPTKQKLRVGILFGGRSSEHEISLISAMSVCDALSPEKYEMIPIWITRQGQWIAGIFPTLLLQKEYEAQQKEYTRIKASGGVIEYDSISVANGSLLFLGKPLDVVFPVLHGTSGEDGTVQGFLELINIPYVGCGVLGGALGMDKDKMKVLFQAAGLATAEALVFRRSEWRISPEQIVKTIEAQIGYPCFIKPANGGSSIGVSKVYTRAHLVQAVQLAAYYDTKLLAERAINCRELSCAVLGNENPITSVVGEVIVQHEYYDYRAKYLNCTSYTVVPADIPRSLSDTIRLQAVQAFRALDLSGLARVDFFLEIGTGRLLINEVNTLPSFTKQCLYPKMCEATGLPYPLLLDYLIELALERHADRQRNHTEVRIDPHEVLVVDNKIATETTSMVPEMIPRHFSHAMSEIGVTTY